MYSMSPVWRRGYHQVDRLSRQVRQPGISKQQLMPRWHLDHRRVDRRHRHPVLRHARKIPRRIRQIAKGLGDERTEQSSFDHAPSIAARAHCDAMGMVIETRMPHRFMLALVRLDQIDQDIEFVSFRASRLGIHQLVYSGECCCIIRFGQDRPHLGHFTPPPR